MHWKWAATLEDQRAQLKFFNQNSTGHLFLKTFNFVNACDHCKNIKNRSRKHEMPLKKYFSD